MYDKKEKPMSNKETVNDIKFCGKCSQWKETKLFHKDRSRKDGITVHCKKCRNEYEKQYYRDNPDKQKERGKRWRENNPDYNREYYAENRSRIREIQREYVEKTDYHQNYYLNNKHKNREKANKRRLFTKKARPIWADQELIDLIYEGCPEGCHVDHFVPIKGKSVCGLHTPDNLQYLPKSLNISKGNKFDACTQKMRRY